MQTVIIPFLYYNTNRFLDWIEVRVEVKKTWWILIAAHPLKKLKHLFNIDIQRNKENYSFNVTLLKECFLARHSS